MGGLWYKELRSLLPFLVLAALIPVLNVCYEFSTDVPSMRPLADMAGEYVIGAKTPSVFVFVLVFALASGLLVREYDEGTMEFLDALPLSRSRVFLIKVTLSLLVPLTFIVLDIGTAVLLHALSRNSLDPSFHPGLLVRALFLRSCQAVFFLGLGLALSFLRRFGWLIAGLMVWAYLLVDELWPAVRLLNLFALTKSSFVGRHWIMPWQQLAVQMTLAGALLVVAYALFLGAGDRLMRIHCRLRENRLGRAILLVGALMIGAVGFGLAYYFFEHDRDPNEDTDGIKITYASWGTSRTRTECYEFVYPNNLAGQAQKVITGADAVHAKVLSFLRAESQDRVLADMTGSFTRYAGLAYWEKVQIDLTTSERAETLQAVLAHETTHVYLDQLSDSRLSDCFNSTRFFHEGVASYVEYRLFQPERAIDSLWSVAAVVRAREQVHFFELVDDKRFRVRNDADLVYPLGELFVEALVHCFGQQSVGKVTRALARDDAPKGLSGLELWQDVFQACDYNLETVLDTFYEKLDEQVERHKELIQLLPRVKGAVERIDEFIVVYAIWEPVEGWSTVCRFRHAEGSPSRRYMYAEYSDIDTFVISPDHFPARVCWYQLGLRDGEGRVIYEPWHKVPL